ncbi:Geranylgeranyl pyrophosphate synthetase [Pyrenophora seminiperda CCB06]|uniref:Geranylgeranyl pyrophosphate synthetase n=1 Tax=Pyrenophora seminiperda CCB06 TaxID=1302712 RepID=A0A3M7M6I2_9PLEO|nr:Geranylgeranyl pyrophosphate synthetase [Pyrenophora seminiperda CCB06]
MLTYMSLLAKNFPKRSQSVSEQEYTLLCSYSWKERTGVPTIYVPGAPPLLTKPTKPKLLSEDNGKHCTDQNVYKSPSHPFEPAFQAIAVMNPDYRFDDIDSVLQGPASQAFVMSFHVVGNTLIVGRRMKSPTTQVDPDLEDAEGHHRVFSYGFGVLKVAVQLEVDSYICDNAEILEDSVFEGQKVVLSKTMSHAAHTAICYDSPQLTTVILAGKVVPHKRTIELKKEKYITREEFPKSYAGNADYQMGLQKLAWLLAELKDVVKKKSQDGAAVLFCLGKGNPLEVHPMQKHVPALPAEVVRRFWT